MNVLAVAAPNTEAADLLDGYSFEISAKDADRLADNRPLVPAGTLVSITYLPTETDAARIAAARAVRELGLVPMPHIAARRVPSQASLDALLGALADEAGVDRLFVIAGDLAAPVGPFGDALAVIAALPGRVHALRTIGIAGYPEGHPQIAAAALERAMCDKLATLAGQGLTAEIMTQFAFSADPLLAWLDRLRRDGVTARVRLGLPGPASVATLLRFAARCGVGTSARVMAKYGASLTRLLNTAGPDRLHAELARGTDPGRHGPVALHLYPFGGLRKMAEWAQAARRTTISETRA